MHSNIFPNIGLWGAVSHGAGPEGAEEVGPYHGRRASLGHGVGAVELGAEMPTAFEARAETMVE